MFPKDFNYLSEMFVKLAFGLMVALICFLLVSSCQAFIDKSEEWKLEQADFRCKCFTLQLCSCNPVELRPDER